ncbi:putative leucine-rich repeat-containing protein DDB_G0290503 [Ruditapes philippinarum]|uniref:putative leucine-rich repeat-containing protein DDB_G0290503 n=1 Tax=Ruditapes philippinarum TaxID=129788 RepID=UPI00295C35A5|nr:putative leucine-rich repeat-containing protein DDB_G0290503 [Ruditapes philippinarum]
MEADNIGPFCKQIGLHINSLDEINPLRNSHILNGVILELFSHFKNCTKIVDVLIRLNPDLSAVNINTLKSRINCVIEIKKKLVSKKKVKGITSLEDLKSQVFESTSNKKLNQTPRKNAQNSCDDKSPNRPNKHMHSPCQSKSEKSHIEEGNEPPLTKDNIPQYDKEKTPIHEKVTSPCSKSERKALNLFDYEIQKKNKNLLGILREVETAKEQLQTLNNRIGHYSVRNVNKRDETAKKNLHLLRDAQRQLLRQKKQSDNENEISAQLNEKVESLKINSNVEIDQHQQKKVNAQKTASYYKVKASKLREKLKSDNYEPVKTLKSKLAEKDAKIDELESNLLLP